MEGRIELTVVGGAANFVDTDPYYFKLLSASTTMDWSYDTGVYTFDKFGAIITAATNTKVGVAVKNVSSNGTP